MSASSEESVDLPRREPARVLVADDQPDVVTAVRLLLKAGGYESEAADSPRAILAAVKARRFDLLLMDLNYTRDTTSGREGLDLLPRLRALDPSLPVVVMTAWGSIELAVEAMRGGATDFVTKPWENRELLAKVEAHAGEDRHPAEASGRTPRDLTVAGRVQARLLPQSGPALKTLEYAGQCAEAEAVGGDGYDFIDLGDGRLGILLADVSGKGIPAALLMAHLQASIRSQCAQAARDLPALLRTVNGLFYAATAPEHYATLFLGIYDDTTRRLRYVNCGHNPPFLLRRDGTADRLAPTGTVVGLLEKWDGTEDEVGIAPGDTLLAFSDGVTEATRADEDFGEPRLVELLRRHRSRSAASVVAAVLTAVDHFGGAESKDDRTVVVAQAR